MAKIEVKNARQVSRKLTTVLRKAMIKELRDKKNRKTIGDIIVGDIKKQSYGQPSAVTKNIREYLENYNSTDPKYRRNNINITFTGELLNDLSNNVRSSTSKGKFTYVIEHSDGKHAPYKTKKNKRKKYADTKFDKKTGTFKQVKRTIKIPYKFISTQLIKRLGYDYLTFSTKSKDNLSKYIKKKLIDALKRI